MKTIGFIPILCESKLINTTPINGKPLIYWGILALAKSPAIDEIVIATDCKEIADIALSFNFPNLKIYNRLPQNAQDTSSTEDVMLEYIQQAKVDPKSTVVLLQATSPLVSANDISKGIEIMQSGKYKSVMSVVRIKRFFWHENGTPLNYDYKNRPRPQNFKGQLMENGAIYINTAENIVKDKNRLSQPIGFVEMPEYTATEINEPADCIIIEKLMQKHCKEKPQPTDIKLFLSDVDGVLTDAGMYYSEHGDELKKFSTYDGMGFKILQEKGIKTGIITSEQVTLNKRRAEKLKLDLQFHGAKNKLEIVSKLTKEMGISLSQVAYIGDDVNDLDLLKNVGVAGCPANARPEIKAIPNIIHLTKKGGEGAVREFVELIIG